MKLGRELAGLTAGIDQLYRTTPRSDGFLDREGLIPVAVATVAPTPLRDYDEATAELSALQGRLPAEAESDLRRAYLDEMIDSLLTLVATFQEKPVPYAERLRRQMRVPIQTVDETTLDGYRSTIRARLDAIGYGDDDLPAAVKRWEDATRVPREQVLAVMADLTREARRRTTALMIDMDHEWLQPAELRDVPFSAYCDYPGRQMLLNLDHSYTHHFLKHLACHEAFPGHLVHLARREHLVAAGLMPLDGAQVVTSSASSALFEGIADNGIFFLNWVETPEDELGVALQRLRAALRCNAAWQLHAEGRAPEDVARFVADSGYQDFDQVMYSLGFLRHGLRAPFVYAYYCGDVAVHAVWQNVPPERRAAFWEYLYGHMHTPATLAHFWQ